MAGMIVPKEPLVEPLGGIPGGQYQTIVTPEAIAGEQVRNWERLGKTADEITDSVIAYKNTKDLDEVNRAETKIKEILMRRKLAANGIKGKHTAGLLMKEEKFFGAPGESFTQPEGEPPMLELQEFNEMIGGMDDRLKPAVEQLKSRLKTAHLGSIGAHEQRETLLSLVEGIGAAVDMEIASSSALSPATTDEEEDINDKAREVHIASIRTKYAALQAAKGLSNEAIELKETTAVSTIRVNTIKNFLANKDVARAEKYLKRYSDEITTDITELKNKIAIRDGDVKAEIFSDEAYVKWKTDPQGAWDYIDAIEDPDTQTKARTELTAKINAETTSRSENLRRAKEIINKQIYASAKGQDGGTIYQTQRVTDLDSDALAIILAHDGPQAVEDIRQNFSDRSKTIEPNKDIQGKANQDMIKLLGTPGGVKKFLEMDIHAEKRNVLGTELTRYWQKEQKNMLDKKPESILNKLDILTPRLKMALLDRPGYELIQERVLRDLSDAVMAAEKAKGDKAGQSPIDLTNDEYTELVNKIVSVGTTNKYKGEKAVEGADTGWMWDPFGTAAAADKKARDAAKIRDLETPTQQVKAYLDVLEEIDFKYGGLQYDKAKDMIARKLVVHITNFETRRGEESTWPQRQRLIEFHLKDNKVNVEDFFGDDRGVPMIMVPPDKYKEAYVMNSGGGKVMISSIDSISKSEKQAAHNFLDKQTEAKDKVRSYQNMAEALYQQGNKRIVSDRRKAVERQRREFSTGTLKSTASGKTYTRLHVLESLEQVSVETLITPKYKKDMRKLYGDDGVEILDWVVRKKLEQEKLAESGR